MRKILNLLKRLKPDLSDLLILAGMSALGVGLWWISPSVSLVALGALTIAGGLALLRIQR